jgi:hypothetical protein
VHLPIIGGGKGGTEDSFPSSFLNDDGDGYCSVASLQ